MPNLVESKTRKKTRLKKLHSMDYALVISTLALSLFGIVMAFSASYYYSISKTGSPYSFLFRNVAYYFLGWILLLIVSRIDYHRYRAVAWPVLILCVVLLIVLIVARNTPLTQTINNATRWINLGFTTIMPGELIKPALILFLAALLSANPDVVKDKKTMGAVFGLFIVIFLLIYKQPNLSTAIIVIAIGFVMLLIAGLNLWTLVAALGIVVLGYVYLMYFNDGYMHTRLVTAIDPWADPRGEGYQVIQGLLALGSGGVKGVGLGRSIQKTLYLPEPQSDFILPIIGEELGLIGIIILLIMYAVFIGRLISIALRAKDSFGSYLAFGTALMIGIHVILNILVITATFPPTGVFLPFMSQGGNATLVILFMVGVVLNISRQAKDAPKEDEI